MTHWVNTLKWFVGSIHFINQLWYSLYSVSGSFPLVLLLPQKIINIPRVWLKQRQKQLPWSKFVSSLEFYFNLTEIVSPADSFGCLSNQEGGWTYSMHFFVFLGHRMHNIQVVLLTVRQCFLPSLNDVLLCCVFFWVFLIFLEKSDTEIVKTAVSGT